MRLSGWLILNGLFFYGLWLAYGKNMAGAQNLMVFVAWAMLAIGISSTQSLDKYVEQGGSPVHPMAGFVVDLFGAGVFAWNGAFAAAGAFTLFAFISTHVALNARALLKEDQPEDQPEDQKSDDPDAEFLRAHGGGNN